MNHRSKHILIPPKSYLSHDKISMGYTYFPQEHKTTSPADVLYYKVFSSMQARSPVLFINYTKNDSMGSAI